MRKAGKLEQRRGALELRDSGNRKGIIPDFLISIFGGDRGLRILNVESRKTGTEMIRSGTQELRESEGVGP